MNERIDKARVIELAERQVKAGRIEEAIAEYGKLLQGDSPDVSINNIIGDLYAQIGRTDEAIRAFQSVASHYESKGYHSQALALYKKISKLAPDDVITIVRMGDLFAAQGFAAEAKREYLKAEQRLRREKRVKELMFLYDKLIKLDRDNVTFKLTQADLFRQEGFIEEAAAKLNDAAELQLSRNEIGEAEKIVEQARWLKEGDERTLTNLVEILKKSNRRQYAIEVVSEILQKNPDNLHFLTVLGTLHLEERELDRAEEIFSRVVIDHPLETRARIKLGKVYALQGRPEKAFELFEPMIAALIKKQKEDKAIGLLGIVLGGGGELYLPALEKLAAIYKSRNHKSHLEVVYRLILQEARKRRLREKMFVALSELLELRPRDEALAREYRELKKEVGFVNEETGDLDARAASEADEADVEMLLAKVDLYLGQGLARNARRILENLRQRFPNSAKIEDRIADLDKTHVDIRDEDIPSRVGRIEEIERKIEATPELAKTFLSLMRDEAADEKRITAADLFADTEILPLPPKELEETKYYDLSGRIAEERELLHSIYTQQLRGDISILEKDLTEIVHDFREQVSKKIDTKDYETRFHLGLAYLEQGLVDEAIEEFLLASEDSSRSLECHSIISKAYRMSRRYDEAAKSLERCLAQAKEGSPEYVALEYELASLHEEKGDVSGALAIYRKIRAHHPGYRDVGERIARLS
jgi:lipopolysaccharide biosynthesis regulator YciM